MDTLKLDVKVYESVLYALGAVRGALNSVLMNDYDERELRRILNGTSLANIAREIGREESDLAMEMESLSECEKLGIKGSTKD